MATLILTAVGTAVAGPIGGAIGALVGQAADAAIFAPKRREGPRLGELAIQTSAYGTAIPKVFGTLRIAGTVIWSTDLIEQRSTSGGGKGRPKTANYTYSASFAVALSGRQIRAVRRIWADGKLLRGAEGDFKSQTLFRLYPGSEEQEPDPLIVSLEGASNTPAYRGIAYAVFEGFQLEDYGNRIPSLTFEVEADPGEVAIGAIAAELSEGAVAAGATPSLGGYAAGGDSVRGVLEALADVAPLSLADEGSKLRLSGDVAAPAPIAGASLLKQPEIVRRSSESVAGEVSIAYHDVARDYQTGLQRASRGSPALRSDRRALPAALTASAAKGFAERRLSALWAGRASARLELCWNESGTRPGSFVRFEGHDGVWKVERWTLGRLSAKLELVQVGSDLSQDSGTASPGRPIGHLEPVHGPTTLRLYDLPLPNLDPEQPTLIAMAAGVESGWRRAELSTSFDSGASWQPVGYSAAPAVLGQTVGALGAAGSALFDERQWVVVELLNDVMWLESRSDHALSLGDNLGLVGQELIQFGRAEPLGSGRFRLSRLLRGRRGTEWAAHLHQPGEDFALIAAHSTTILDGSAAGYAGEVRLMAVGRGDDSEPVTASRAISAEALRPPTPVHLRALWVGDDLKIDWVRRSRQGWNWQSGTDAPLGEQEEAYLLQISGSGALRRTTLSRPGFVYTAAQRAFDGHAGSFTVSVEQMGTFARSRAAQISVSKP
jgi:hypothetical protein